jgi:hypothetical protein
MEIKKEVHPFNEAGRMVKAAVITALMRTSSIDRTLRELPEEAGAEWAEVAERLMRKMQDKVAMNLIPPAPAHLSSPIAAASGWRHSLRKIMRVSARSRDLRNI